jgi:cytochrome c-type biogenesis protein CcmH/NrfG
VDEERMAELEGIVAADSSDVDALVELGHLYLATQRFDVVARLSMQALELEPHNVEALTHLGMVLVAANHVSEAQAAFDRALAVEPDFHEALLYKGIVAFRNRDFQTAVEAWEHYLEVAPSDANVGRVRGMLEGARQAAGTTDAP